jgi:hypothetical protein
MLKLKKLKQEQDAKKAADKAGPTASPGELRVQKEVADIDTVKDKSISCESPLRLPSPTAATVSA